MSKFAIEYVHDYFPYCICQNMRMMNKKFGKLFLLPACYLRIIKSYKFLLPVYFHYRKYKYSLSKRIIDDRFSDYKRAIDLRRKKLILYDAKEHDYMSLHFDYCYQTGNLEMLKLVAKFVPDLNMKINYIKGVDCIDYILTKGYQLSPFLPGNLLGEKRYEELNFLLLHDPSIFKWCDSLPLTIDFDSIDFILQKKVIIDYNSWTRCLIYNNMFILLEYFISQTKKIHQYNFVDLEKQCGYEL